MKEYEIKEMVLCMLGGGLIGTSLNLMGGNWIITGIMITGVGLMILGLRRTSTNK